MSDVQGTEGEPAAEAPEELYVSSINPLFAAAFNKVHHPDLVAKAAEESGKARAAGAGAEAPAAEGAGDGGEAASAATPGAGDAPAGAPAGDAPAGAGAATDPAATDPAAGAVTSPGDPADLAPGVGTLDYEELKPVFATASAAVTTRMEEAFKSQALGEIKNEIDPTFVTLLEQLPSALVGKKVPSLAPDAKPEDKIILATSLEAKQYLDDVETQIQASVDERVRGKITAVAPMAEIIQNSFTLFQNNPDLVWGTKQYDPQLADEFMALASTWEQKVNGKVIGYAVDVQPLINKLRTDLSTRRGAEAQRNEDKAVKQREQAANQPRTAGRFSAPQAGIPSQANMSGEGEDSMDAFWQATPFANLRL